MNPLRFIDVRGIGHTEPSVTAFTQIQADEPRQIDPINDLIIISDFRSGKPKTLFDHRDLFTLGARHDPQGNNDSGVALARYAKVGIAERDVFGAAAIRTIRVNPATNGQALLKAGASDLIRVERADYGSHTNGPGITVGDGTIEGKKITIQTPGAPSLIGDNLGLLLSVQYKGDATTALLSILNSQGKITYTGQVADVDKITIVTATQTKIFEFDNNAAVTGGNVLVTIGADADATFANLAAAISANLDNVTVDHDAVNNTILIDAPEAGIVVTETTDSTAKFAVQNIFPSARLKITLAGDQTDGSASLDIPLALSGYDSIDRLATFINNQLGYEASVKVTANKFLPSTGLDVVTNQNAKAAPLILSGFNAALVDWINTRTRQNYTATELLRSEPDDQTVVFTGGTTPPATVNDYADVLQVIASTMQLGGIILTNTDDPAIFAMVNTFVYEQYSQGKWFRAFFGAKPAQTPQQYDTIAASIDEEKSRLTCQRLAILEAGGVISYLHPVYYAAVLAGGAAGNRPFVKPLTNKRLRFVGIHPDDEFDEVTRSALIEAGITVAKREADALVTVLGVTTSRDTNRRMVRIMSEIDTVYMIEANVRAAFLKFRGEWSSSNIDAMVRGTLTRVLGLFVDTAIVKGLDEAGNEVPAFRLSEPPYIIEAGVVRLGYQIFIGSEINHISILGRAQYQRIVGEITGTLVTLSTPVPLAA